MKTIAKGLGVWKRLAHESIDKLRQRIVNKPGQNQPSGPMASSPYDFTDNSSNECYVMVYSGLDRNSAGLTPTRKLKRIYVKKNNDCKYECKFETYSDPKTNADAGSLCGEYSDVGAPVMCGGDAITHIVTKVIEGQDSCSHRFMAMKLADYRSDLK